MPNKVDKIYGNRIRVRVCGLCWENTSLLLVNHKGMYESDFWAPPGGGVGLHRSAEEELKREFLEETGLVVEIDGFRFACEVIREHLHAVELFFDVHATGGQLQVGADPELPPEEQIISQVSFLEYARIMALPSHETHGLFGLFRTEKELQNASGYFKI